MHGFGQLGRQAELALAQQDGPAQGVALSVDEGLHAPPGDGAELRGAPAGTPFRGGGEDGPGQGVLGVGLHRAGQRQHLIVAQAAPASPVTT